jgi:hypothetical protein
MLVTRSDMALTKTVSLKYMPIKIETIKFRVGGKFYFPSENINVEKWYNYC